MSDTLKQLQNAFSHSARGHEETQSFDFEKQRLSIYQDLLLNNLHEVISPCFPVLLSLLPTDIWRAILQDFLKQSHVSTPIFHELPFYMVNYLEKHPISKYPFAFELAHYEWVELEVELSEPNQPPQVNGSISLLDQTWKLSSTARLLEYNYEVDKISLDYQPHTEVKTYLIVYQIKSEVEFLKINELSFQLLTLMLQESTSARVIIQMLSEIHAQLNENELVSACIPLITQLYDEQILQPTQTILKNINNIVN